MDRLVALANAGRMLGIPLETRDGAERALARSARLLALVSEVSHARTREKVAELVVAELLVMLTMRACAVTLQRAGGGLEVLAAHGFGRDSVEEWLATGEGEMPAVPAGLRDVTRFLPLVVDGRSIGTIVVAVQ